MNFGETAGIGKYAGWRIPKAVRVLQEASLWPILREESLRRLSSYKKFSTLGRL
jgi:hypothetical protein